MARELVLGFDPADLSDYAAIVLLEKVQRGEDEPYSVRVLNVARWNSTGYTATEGRIAEVVRAIRRRGDRVTLVIDVTAHLPVLDHLREKELEAETIGVHIKASGDATPKAGRAGVYNVSAQELVQGAQVLVEQDRLQAHGRVRHMELLRRELANFRVKKNRTTNHDTYEAHREGDHDDLVFACAVGLWWIKDPFKFELLIGRVPLGGGGDNPASLGHTIHIGRFQ